MYVNEPSGLKSKIESILSDILSDKYDENIRITFPD